MSLYEQSVPHFEKTLTTVEKWIDKAVEHAKSKNFEPDTLLTARLAPDMFPLTRQVQIAADMVKGAAARLSGTEIPKFEDNEASIADLKARIAKTLAFINGIAADKFEGGEKRDILLQMRRGDLRFVGGDYLRDFVLPNLYFHVATAYAILRHNGVELGKQDFLGA